MSWDEFCGSEIAGVGATEDSNIRPHPDRPYQGVGATLDSKDLVDPNPGVQYVPTTGTILVLNFAEVIQLTEEL